MWRSETDGRPQRDDYGGGRRDPDPPKVYSKDTIFVGNLSKDADARALVEFFGTIGHIKRTRIHKEWDRTPLGECTITYADEANAIPAIQQYNGKEFMGQVIEVQLADMQPHEMEGRRGGGGDGGYGDRGGYGGGSGTDGRRGDYGDPREPDRPPKVYSKDTIFVGNLSKDADARALVEFFGTIGNIKRTRIHKERDGTPLGECTITYADEANAIPAIQQYNGKEFMGQVIKVHLADMQPHEMEADRGRGGGGGYGDRGGYGDGGGYGGGGGYGDRDRGGYGDGGGYGDRDRGGYGGGRGGAY